jgi:predicted glycosyltransferase
MALQHTRPLAVNQQQTGRSRLAITRSVKETDISTKDWRATKMTQVVNTFFNRVWSKGEVCTASTGSARE